MPVLAERPATRPMTIYPTEELYNQIEALGFVNNRARSPMAVILLEEAIEARSMPEKLKPATE